MAPRVVQFDESRSSDALEACRRALPAWRRLPTADRLEILRGLRHAIADDAEALAATVTLAQRKSATETISAELLPLADAIRFLEREAEAILATRRPGRRGRPFWLGRSQLEIRRVPRGVVLVIGPSNYPLLLVGVPLVQALAAGNTVLIKPGAGGRAAARALLDRLHDAGLPEGVVDLLDESAASAARAIDDGVDHVVMTGSWQSGRAVAERLATGPTSATLELSGCDALFVAPDADVELAARAVAFALGWNSGFTCIAPRRLFVAPEIRSDFERALCAELRSRGTVESHGERQLIDEAIALGARIAYGDGPVVLADVPPGARVLDADLASPLASIVAFDEWGQAPEIAACCRFALGATAFGSVPDDWFDRLGVGVVVRDDILVPTADPRLPFGGSGASGYGVTRGAEGLLELTRTQSVVRRKGTFRPHLDPVGDDEQRLVRAFLTIGHARGLRARLGGLRRALAAMRSIGSKRSER